MASPSSSQPADQPPAPRSLWVTNDFPPRSGGIEQFVANVVATLDPEGVMVLASPWEGDTAHDAALPYRVDRISRRPLLPTPGVIRTVNAAIAEHRADAVVFGSAWPLAEMAGRLDAPTVAITHGREAGMCRVGFAPFMRRLGRRNTVMTLLSDYTAERLEPLLAPLTRLHRLPGGVDTAVFTPDGPTMRERHGLGEAPTVVCISRLVPRKGQDTLVRIWPRVQQAVPDARLLLVGTGPIGDSLEDAVAAAGLGRVITFTGEVPWSELPAYYRTGDVFAMPCRTRLAGMDVEGLGLVFLEAQASGVPVIVGDSGGAPETVRHGVTGLVVDGDDDEDVLAAVVDLLADESRRRTMGAAAVEHARSRWAWPVIGRQLVTAMRDAVHSGG